MSTEVTNTTTRPVGAARDLPAKRLRSATEEPHGYAGR